MAQKELVRLPSETDAQYARRQNDVNHDAFPTPDWAVAVACQWMLETLLIDFPGKPTLRILDAGAGDGRWGYYMRKTIEETHLLDHYFPASATTHRPQVHLTGVEIRNYQPHHDVYDEWVVEDFLCYLPKQRFHLIMGNPPFGKPLADMAEKFVHHAMPMTIKYQSGAKGYACFFLRNSFMNGTKRASRLYTQYPITYLIPFADRPVFIGEASDSKTDYSMFAFRDDSPFRGTLDYLRLQRPPHYREMAAQRLQQSPLVLP